MPRLLCDRSRCGRARRIVVGRRNGEAPSSSGELYAVDVILSAIDSVAEEYPDRMSSTSARNRSSVSESYRLDSFEISWKKFNNRNFILSSIYKISV